MLSPENYVTSLTTPYQWEDLVLHTSVNQLKGRVCSFFLRLQCVTRFHFAQYRYAMAISHQWHQPIPLALLSGRFVFCGCDVVRWKTTLLMFSIPPVPLFEFIYWLGCYKYMGKVREKIVWVKEKSGSMCYIGAEEKWKNFLVTVGSLQSQLAFMHTYLLIVIYCSRLSSLLFPFSAWLEIRNIFSRLKTSSDHYITLRDKSDNTDLYCCYFQFCPYSCSDCYYYGIGSYSI